MFDYFMLLGIAEKNVTIVLEITPGKHHNAVF